MPLAPRRFQSTALAVALLILSSMACAAEGGAHWSYGGATGPGMWGGLETDYASCSLGKAQSPIDIQDDLVRTANLPSIDFDYKPAPLRIIDNGHTIQINYEPGSFISVGGHRYELLQFHFHRPSEEEINGRRFAMVAHLVHRDAEGKLAVVAVLLSGGNANPLIEKLWSNLPQEKNKESVVPSVEINPSALLPQSKAYYTFAGSLTTPPCSEGVTWLVMRNATSVAASQVARFAELYPMNARPVQPLNGRRVATSR